MIRIYIRDKDGWTIWDEEVQDDPFDLYEILWDLTERFSEELSVGYHIEVEMP